MSGPSISSLSVELLSRVIDVKHSWRYLHKHGMQHANFALLISGVFWVLKPRFGLE